VCPVRAGNELPDRRPDASLGFSLDDGDGRFCPQQVLVRNLIEVFVSDAYQGEFRRQIARADLARLFESGSANRLFSEFITGLN